MCVCWRGHPPKYIVGETLQVIHFVLWLRCVYVYAYVFVYSLCGNCFLCSFFISGLITTTSRKLDREQRTEHNLEVRTPIYFMCVFLSVVICCSVWEPLVLDLNFSDMSCNIGVSGFNVYLGLIGWRLRSHFC